MEPILVSLLRPLLVHALALTWLCAELLHQTAARLHQGLVSRLTADPQRLAIFAAWEAELFAGWQEPVPVQPELLELPVEPALEALLDQLPAAQAASLRLTILAGLSLRQAARQLGISAMSVQRAQKKALATLRQQVSA